MARPSAVPTILLSGVSACRPCSWSSAVWIPLTCIRTVPPSGRANGLRRSPPASRRNCSIRRRTSRAAAPAGSRRFFRPSSSCTTVSGMTMSAPGNASKMPSGSDIKAEVSKTTILAMTASLVTPGCASPAVGVGVSRDTAAVEPASSVLWYPRSGVGDVGSSAGSRRGETERPDTRLISAHPVVTAVAASRRRLGGRPPDLDRVVVSPIVSPARRALGDVAHPPKIVSRGGSASASCRLACMWSANPG